MLTVKSLHIGYEFPLNKESINGTFGKGEVIVLLGDNGVGKSTFLKTLAGLIQPVAGQFALDTDKIGWVDSSISKGVYLSVSDFLSFGIDASLEEKQEWLNRFDLAIPLTRFLDELSDGQFRKLCLIRQLLKKPDVLFLDEPTVYLDIKSKDKLIEVIKEIKANCMVFCSTHDMLFAEAIQTQIIKF